MSLSPQKTISQFLVFSLLLILSQAAIAQDFIHKCKSAVISRNFSRLLLEVQDIDLHYDVDYDIYTEKSLEIARLNCKKLETLAIMIEKTKRTFGNALIYPRTIDVNMKESHNNAYNFSDALEIPQVFFNFHPRKDKKLTKHPKYTYPIWLHEYGHSIYNHVLRAKSPRWNAAFKINTTYKNQMLNFTKQHHPLLRKCHASYQQLVSNGKSVEHIYKLLNPQCQEKIYKLRNVASNALNKYEREFQKYQALYTASSPYEEFFADLVAVAMMNDGATMAKSMKFSGIHYHKSPHIGFSRDMTSPKNDLDSLKSLQATQISRSAHDTLSSARRHMWKYYLSNAKYKYKKGQILQRVMKAIFTEIVFLEKSFYKYPQLSEILFPSSAFGGDRLNTQQLKVLRSWTYKLNERLINSIEYQMGHRK